MDDIESWIDPIVGAKWLWDYAKQWKLFARVDICRIKLTNKEKGGEA